MAEEKTLTSKQIYKGRIINVRVDTVELHDGGQTTREIVEHSECVAVVAIDTEKNVLMVRQYRKPAEKSLLEIPAGGVEENETPESCAERELQEETGYFPQKLEKIGGFFSSPGFCTEFMHLYLATDIIPNPLSADADEDIELVRVPLSRIPQLIRNGDICDAKSIAGLLMVISNHR